MKEARKTINGRSAALCIFLTFILVFSSVISVLAYDEGEKVNYTHTTDANGVDVFNIDGNIGFCCEPGKHSSDSGKMTIEHQSRNSKLAKAFYYCYTHNGNWFSKLDQYNASPLGPYWRLALEMISQYAVQGQDAIDYWNDHWPASTAAYGSEVKTFVNETCANVNVPSDFRVFVGKQSGQDSAAFYIAPVGYLQIQKQFESGKTINDSSKYSLAGAVYYVYTDQACTSRAKDTGDHDISLTTNASGATGKVEVTEGTYWIKEQTPSTGCKLDGTVRSIKVTQNHTESSPALVNSVEPLQTGYVYLVKSAQETDTNYLTEAPNNYTLEGAVYELYTASGARAKDINGNNVTLTTKADGTTDAVEISMGTYHAIETTASKGFKIDDTVQTKDVTVTASNTAQSPAKIQSTEVPVKAPFEFKFRKVDTSGNHGYKQLLGTEYTISYYDVDMGYGNDAPTEATIEGETAKRSWTYTAVKKTDESGQPYAGFDTAEDDPSEGSSALYTEDGGKILPRGVFTIEETKAAPGMARDKTVYYCRVFQSENGAEAASVFDANLSSYGDGASLTVNLNDDEQHPALKIEKKDADTGEASPVGTDRDYVKGSLAGATYAVYYDDPAQDEPQRVGTITTDEDGIGTLEKRTEGDERFIGDWLPLGRYFIEEETAPAGYVKDQMYYEDKDGEYKDGQHIVMARAQTGDADSFTYAIESLEKHHITHISKTDITTGKELPGASLQVLDSEGNIVEEWVSTDKPHDILALHDETQGLKDGDYTLREITAPYGYDTAEDVEFKVVSNAIENSVEMKNAPIEIRTTATDTDTETHQGTFSAEEKIKDVVKFKNLYAGRTYTFKGTLMDKATGEALTDSEGKEITAETDYTPEGEAGTLVSGEVELEFTVDASEFTKDKSVVAFEKVFREERELAMHADLEDADQTINYGGIVGTTAVDAKSKGHNILGEKDAVIVDTIRFENLSTAETYTVKGELFDKTTGKLTGIKAEGTFKPKSTNGTTEVSFKFDASKFKGHKLVAYETLLIGSIEINKHEDPDDEDQTVNVPEIKTLAVDSETNDHIANADKSVTITDTVSYNGLKPNKTYTLKGTLQYRDGALNKLKTVTKNGKPLVAETTFTPTTESGTAVVTFKFNGVDLAGKTTVVFEDLYDGKYVVATHADPDDADQSVHLPRIATKVGKKSGDYVIDTVAYRNLIPGKTYTIKGYFVEKSSGDKIKGSDGELTFTPDKPSGKVEVKLKPVKAGKTLVAFESVYLVDENDNEILVGEHKDLNDKAQTLTAKGKPATGDTSLIVLYGCAFALLSALIIILNMIKKRAASN